MRLTDDELRGLCEQELTGAAAYSADLSEERASAMDMYLGEPIGNEQPNRSQVRTREVLDTVEWVLPSLMRIFSDADNLCAFEPVGPEDEQAAEQESETVNHVFWQSNHGLLNLYAFIKDGLLSKNGVLKVWWDAEPQTRREEYQGLNDWELAQLLFDQDADTEVVEHDQDEQGLHNVTLMVTDAPGRLRIEPCPPEEFGVSRDARSIDIDAQDFVFHRTRKTKAELIEMGYDRKTVEGLPSSNNDVLTRERLARRYLSDEREDYDHGDHWSMERVWLTECYIRVDRDDDGVAELLQVTLAGQDSNYATGSVLLDVEEVDRAPFCTWTPVMRTHAFYGLSVADLVADLQLISTGLTRQMLDATYLANNARTAINDRVNLEDLLTSRPGGVVRVQGDDAPSNSIMPIPQQALPPQSFEMLERLDEMRQRRTGVGDEVGALDGNDLAQINTGVAAIAYDASRSKIELMARLCAELGIKPLFQRIHELLRKHSDKPLALKMRGGWVQVRPQSWRERTDMTVQVGIGHVSRERRLTALSDVLEKQAAAAQAGAIGTLLMPQHMYKAVADYTRELGLEESLYWMDPSQAPPPQEEPDYQKAALMLQQGQVEALMQRNQVEAQKVASNERIRIAELEQKERELMSKAEIEALKADLVHLKSEREQSEKGAKTALDAEIAAREQEIRAAEVRLKDSQESSKREVEVYKALLQSGTTLTQEQMRVAGSAEPGTEVGNLQQAMGQMVAQAMQQMTDAMSSQIGEVRAQLQEAADRANTPKVIKRDKDGKIASIGDAAVRYGTDGRVESIG